MPKFLLALAFHLLSLANAIASFFAIFVVIGMSTNANGFLSGTHDVPMLLLVLSFPTCFVISAMLYNFRGERLAAVLVGLIPAAFALGLYVVTHSL